MTLLASAPIQPPTFLDDLTPDSGLAERRWTPEEFRRMFSTELLSTAENLKLVDGMVVEADTSALRPFRRVEYYNLTDFGILGPEERTELIYGRVIKRMSPMSRPHSLSISKTALALEEVFSRGHGIEQQTPLHVARGLEPEPDVMVLRKRSEDYPATPQPPDVLLLVEVSYSTLEYDRNTKATLYAENGIADYWIVNLRARTLEVYRQPEDGRYVSLRVYSETEAIAPLAAPNALVQVGDLLPMVQTRRDCA